MTIFFSIATLFLSMAVVVIAWQQWRVAKNKLRLDLFDRRYKVYEATRTFLGLVAREAPFTEAEFMDFRVHTWDAQFFFEPDLAEYLTQIGTRALDMRVQQRLYTDLPEGDERSRHVQAEHDQYVWLKNQFSELPKMFAPYLEFANIKYGGEIREVNKGVNRLAILLGIFGALAWWIFVGVITKGFSTLGHPGVGEWLILVIATAVAFIIPFALVHAIAWVARGFKQ